MIIIQLLRRLALGMVGCFKQRDVSLAPHYICLHINARNVETQGLAELKATEALFIFFT